MSAQREAPPEPYDRLRELAHAIVERPNTIETRGDARYSLLDTATELAKLVLATNHYVAACELDDVAVTIIRRADGVPAVFVDIPADGSTVRINLNDQPVWKGEGLR